jgi:hypothetical protein
MRSVLALVVFAALGCKGDPVKCEKACRNYAELTYWKKADAEINAAPVAERDALRKKKVAEFSAKLERGIDMCTSKCMSANSDDQTKCLIEAKTADEAHACADEAETMKR